MDRSNALSNSRLILYKDGPASGWLQSRMYVEGRIAIPLARVFKMGLYICQTHKVQPTTDLSAVESQHGGPHCDWLQEAVARLPCKTVSSHRLVKQFFFSSDAQKHHGNESTACTAPRKIHNPLAQAATESLNCLPHLSAEKSQMRRASTRYYSYSPTPALS